MQVKITLYENVKSSFSTTTYIALNHSFRGFYGILQKNNYEEQYLLSIITIFYDLNYKSLYL